MYRPFLCGILAILCWSMAAEGQVNNVMVRNEDICGAQNGRRLYLELGEKGILYATNVSFAKNEARQDGSRVYASNSSHAQCTLELVTCPSCVIILTFQSIALSHHCGDGSVTMDSPCRAGLTNWWLARHRVPLDLAATLNGSLHTYQTLTIAVEKRSKEAGIDCDRQSLAGMEGGRLAWQQGGRVLGGSRHQCDYVWISEPPYEDVSGTPFCGLYAPITYRSSTRTLSITLLYSQSHMHAFTLEYTAERNRLHLRGTELATSGQPAKGLNSTGGGILTSPFFPARYPRDLGLEYIITCPSQAPSCRIRLLFSDFQLATVSIMEFYDWNGQRLDVSSGAKFRPPVIMSSGPSLLIRFYANGGTGLGYKAFYSFVVGHAFDKSVQPITDCGGYVENLGGAITMMDMVDEGVKTYDCVWLIRPPKNFLHMKTHMYLKVVTFAEMAGNTELVVKQGPTSALLPLEILRHPASQVQPPRHREHVAPVTSGFHVSLRGTFGPSSHLAIAYAAFSYMDCFAGSDFLCRNHRCIPNQLNCDGFDHCGDNSDEPTSCYRDWEMEPQDRKWHVNKANYYFPKIDRYPDLKTATLVFVASSLGLIVLISALIILLYRMGARARQQRELQSRLQTISELLDGARIDEISVSDDPPVYEAPPGYDEVVKLGLDAEIVARKKRRGFGRGSRGTSSPGQNCSLDVGRSPACSTTETTTASSSRGNWARPLPNADVHSIPQSSATCLPESPPPPYVTPPESTSRSFAVPSSTTASSAHAGERSEISREEEETGRRRDWFRRAGQFSLSLSGSCEPPTDSPSRASLSLEAEFFGAYPRNRQASSSIRTAVASCDSQPRSSCAASTDTVPDCGGRGDGGGDTASVPCPCPVVQRVEPQHDGTTVEDDINTSCSSHSCSCEGACACATAVRSPSADTERKGDGVPPRSIGCHSIGVLTNEQVLGRAEEEKGNDEEGGEEPEPRCCRSRSTIVRLLGARTGRLQSGNGGPTTTTSTRKFSVYPRDGHVGKVPGIGSTSSYEKLSLDELEITRKTVLYASDPTSIDSGDQRRRVRRARRYSSCDLDNLCEGVAVLDGLLVRRGVAHGRKQSVTVMLFGTPAHGTFHRPATDDDDEEAAREMIRVSRLSLDVMPN